MYKNLYIFFKYLKFNYNYYNLVLVRSERLFQNAFFTNNVNSQKSFNLNFVLDHHWSFLNRKTSYSLGFSSSFFNFKTTDFFFNFLSSHFCFQKLTNVISTLSISSSDGKNSRKLWKFKLVSVLLNFFDWSIFFKNGIKKAKALFLFGSTHPLQSINLQRLKSYDLDTYNKNDINFNVDISDNNAMNQSKNLLLSEIFFINNDYISDLDVFDKTFSFFFFKIFSTSKLFNAGRPLFGQPVILSFYFFVNYPYYFKNNFFKLVNVKDFNVSINFFFDKNKLDGVSTLSNLDVIFLKYAVANFSKNNNTLASGYSLFLTNVSLLFFYGIAKKKKKCYFKKCVKKNSNKKVRKSRYVVY